MGGMDSVFYPACKSIEEFSESIYADMERKRRAPKTQKLPEPALPQFIPYDGSASHAVAVTSSEPAEVPSSASTNGSEDEIAKAIDAVLSRPPKASRRYDCIASDGINEVYVCRAAAVHAESILRCVCLYKHVYKSFSARDLM